MTAIKNGTLLVKDSNGNTARVATLSQTDITTLNTALGDIEANKRKINSISANYVTTNTAQTITGKKTLTTTNKSVVTNIRVTNTDNTVTPTENLWINAINALDKNGKGEGALQFSRRTDGRNWVTLQSCIQNANGNDITSSIGIGLKADGTALTSAPNPVSDSNDNNIATTKWVNNKINLIKNNYVTTNTEQTISGDKSFTQKGEPFRIKDANFDVSKTPSQTVGNGIVTYDKNNKQVGYYQVLQESNGNNANSINAVNYKTDGTIVRAHLTVGIGKTGTTYTYAPTPSSSSNDSSIATTKWVNSKISTGGGSNPVGTIIPFAGSSIPAGYLLCNGAEVSRTTYANLFKVIGTTWGAGDGSTTFKLPDTRSRFPEGASGNLGAYHAARLPNITGYIGVEVDTGSVGGAFYKNASNVSICNGTSGVINIAQVTLSALRLNSIYSESGTTVQPSAFRVQYLIKY